MTAPPNLDPKALKRTLDALFTAESGGDEPPAYVLIAVGVNGEGYADFDNVRVWSNVEEALEIAEAVVNGMEPDKTIAMYVPRADA